MLLLLVPRRKHHTIGPPVVLLLLPSAWKGVGVVEVLLLTLKRSGGKMIIMPPQRQEITTSQVHTCTRQSYVLLQAQLMRHQQRQKEKEKIQILIKKMIRRKWRSKKTRSRDRLWVILPGLPPWGNLLVYNVRGQSSWLSGLLQRGMRIPLWRRERGAWNWDFNKGNRCLE